MIVLAACGMWDALLWTEILPAGLRLRRCPSAFVRRPYQAGLPQPHCCVTPLISSLKEFLALGLDIIEGGKVVYRGGEGPFGYKTEEVGDWLASRFPGVTPP